MKWSIFTYRYNPRSVRHTLQLRNSNATFSPPRIHKIPHYQEGRDLREELHEQRQI